VTKPNYADVPDTRLPLEETLEGIDELYRAGAFRRFGLSNFSIAMVEEVLRITHERGFVSPSVYQGNYNAVTRRVEASLFPILRKHKIAFYAFSPIAGGFLAKRPEDLAGGVGTGRWDTRSQPGGMYNEMFVKPPKMLAGLGTWGEIAKEEGISNAELAYRWTVYNSVLRGELGDGVILGARNFEQLNAVMEGIEKGPLSAEAEKKIDALWETIKDEAPSDDPTDIIKVMLA
jgi:aflatoxin B1 aldehyde reductase